MWLCACGDGAIPNRLDAAILSSAPLLLLFACPSASRDDEEAVVVVLVAAAVLRASFVHNDDARSHTRKNSRATVY